jgi:uncharacterized protein
VSVYLDANALVAVFTHDSFTSRAEAFLAARPDVLIVSDFAALEVSAVVARRVRTRTMTAEQGRSALAAFDAWVGVKSQRIRIEPRDLAVADAFVRQHDLPIRAPDAIHLSIARRTDALLMSFDFQMAAAARVLGIPVAPA